MQDKRILGWEHSQVTHGASGGNAARPPHRVMALHGIRHDGKPLTSFLWLSGQTWAGQPVKTSHTCLHRATLVICWTFACPVGYLYALGFHRCYDPHLAKHNDKWQPLHPSSLRFCKRCWKAPQCRSTYAGCLGLEA